MIIDDNIYEGDETIIYTLQEEPGSYRLDPDDRTATITILENEPVPSLTVTAFPGAEGGRNQGVTPVGGQEFGNVVFRFNLDGPAAVPISMNLETIDGAAVRGDDYRFNNPTLVFPAGQTEMFIKLPVIDDADFDGTRNEDFDLVASNPSLPVFTGRLRATGYILDNETPPPGVDYVDDSIRTDAYIDVGESWVNGNAIIGGIEHRYDQDWYRTVLRADRCYQIEVRGKDAWEDFQEYPADHPIQEYAPAQELTLSDPLIHGRLHRPGQLHAGHPGRIRGRRAGSRQAGNHRPDRHGLHRGQPRLVRRRRRKRGRRHLRPVADRPGPRVLHPHGPQRDRRLGQHHVPEAPFGVGGRGSGPARGHQHHRVRPAGRSTGHGEH